MSEGQIRPEAQSARGSTRLVSHRLINQPPRAKGAVWFHRSNHRIRVHKALRQQLNPGFLLGFSAYSSSLIHPCIPEVHVILSTILPPACFSRSSTIPRDTMRNSYFVRFWCHWVEYKQHYHWILPLLTTCVNENH
jgi:hypothetical protein